MFQKFLLTLIPLLTLTACMHEADDPRQVAEQYWQALKNGDTETARSLVSRNSQHDFDSYIALPAEEKTPIDEIKLGTEQTTVATVIYPERNIPDEFTAFDTLLVMEDGKWKIDASQTVIPRSTPSDRELDELADELSESMEENIESLEEAMNEGLQILDEALREGSRDMGESMLKGMEEMNRALRESIEEMQKRREEQKPKVQPKPKEDGEGLI